jgi:hypothetical protein
MDLQGRMWLGMMRPRAKKEGALGSGKMSRGMVSKHFVIILTRYSSHGKFGRNGTVAFGSQPRFYET